MSKYYLRTVIIDLQIVWVLEATCSSLDLRSQQFFIGYRLLQWICICDSLHTLVGSCINHSSLSFHLCSSSSSSTTVLFSASCRGKIVCPRDPFLLFFVGVCVILLRMWPRGWVHILILNLTILYQFTSVMAEKGEGRKEMGFLHLHWDLYQAIFSYLSPKDFGR